MMKLCFKRLRDEAVAPSKSKDIRDAGFDLFTPDTLILLPGQRRVVPLGLIVWFEPQRDISATGMGWYGRIAPKSGLAAKYGIDTLAGVKDATYCGPEDELRVVLLNTADEHLTLAAGSPIAQIIPEVIWLSTDTVGCEVEETPLRINRGSGIDG